MFTAGKLAKTFRLSRTALLYYDSIGLLSPKTRSAARYRQYTDADVARLQLFCTLRDAGLPLKEIKRVLEMPRNALVQALECRLEDLNEEIDRLRSQQLFIIDLLKSDKARTRVRIMNKSTWTSILEAAGFSQTDRELWHAEFERLWPEKHQQFLEFLCIPEAEIEEIRKRAREMSVEHSRRSSHHHQDSSTAGRRAREKRGRMP
jgi:MerR family transcriptional regulator, thiopeptide resistance regulator